MWKDSPQLEIEFLPGISYAFTGASLLGSPLTKDFAVLTLSDNFFEQKESINRIICAAKNNFVIVFYGAKNSSTKNLLLAKKILMECGKENNVVGITKNLGNLNQEIIITLLKNLDVKSINQYTTIFIGRNDTRISNTRSRKIVTPLY